MKKKIRTRANSGGQEDKEGWDTGSEDREAEEGKWSKGGGRELSSPTASGGGVKREIFHNVWAGTKVAALSECFV